MKEIIEGEEVRIKRTGEHAKVRRKRTTPAGTTLYGVVYMRKIEDTVREKNRANYDTFCDAYCVRADLEPLML